MGFRHLVKILLCAILVSAGSAHASREHLRLLAGAARQAARGDTATALEVCERLLSRSGRGTFKPSAMFLKGSLEAGLGRLDTASAVFRRLIVEYPGSDRVGRALTELGLILNRQGRDSAAVRLLEPVAAYFPDSAFTGPALIALARSAERCGFRDKALQAYMQYLALGDQGLYLETALSRSAELLYSAGRVEEAWFNLERLKQFTGRTDEQLDLPARMLLAGCLTGLGFPDSALIQIEEMRRVSGDQLLELPELQFLAGHAYLALNDLGTADSIFTGLASRADLESTGIPSDSLYRLLIEIDLSQGRYDEYFVNARALIRSLDDPRAALGVLEQLDRICLKMDRLEPVGLALDVFSERFGRAGEAWQRAGLIRVGVLSRKGRKQQALEVLDRLEASGGSMELQARKQLARCFVFLNDGDSLRAEAELKDYLLGEDVLDLGDSLLWMYASLERAWEDIRREAELLDTLISRYPASRFWDRADRRLEQLRLFELSNPELAARELLDLFRFQKGQVSPRRLAEVAAGSLGDYDRAAAILHEGGVSSDSDRLKLIEYRYLAGLKMSRTGSLQAAERIAQAWRELVLLLGQAGQFPGRDDAVGLLVKMFRSPVAGLSPDDRRQAWDIFLNELPHLRPGVARSALLFQLGEGYLERARADTGIAVIFLADTARVYLTQVVKEGGGLSLVGRSMLELARSLEQARFAGARDSAAYLYGQLIERSPGTRWSALAGFRLGVIHLRQEHYSQAYRDLGQWVIQNRCAASDPQVTAAMAEAAFLTGRYARASVFLPEAIEQNAFDRNRQRLYRFYHIRALTALGRFAGAENRLIDFRSRYTDPRAAGAADAAAVELYSAAGYPALAGHYLERVERASEHYPVARIFWLRQLLSRGVQKPDRVRKELEDLRRAPWSALFGIDPALEAYRAIMACYMAEGKVKDVTRARDEFRKRYPERRAGLAELILDEVDYLVSVRGRTKAGTLYGDLQLLFRDVYPRDRNLWTGAALKRLEGDSPGSGKLLEELAGRYPWSRYALRSRRHLAYLYLGAGQLDAARRILVEKGVPEFSDYDAAGLEGALEGAAGNRAESVGHYRRQWVLAGIGRGGEEALLGWAEAAMKSGRRREALEILSGLWSPDPELCARARFMLGQWYKAEGADREALEVMGAVAEAFAFKSEYALRALYQKGLIQESMGDKTAAAQTYHMLEKQAGRQSDWARTARNRLRSIAPKSSVEPSNP
ncbi:MAG: tetratricopeptide repeat protein [Gemmatimonadota bacterium]|nr:tetratricopeptide repeat protein [Gemmatimonadota bacterium]